MGAPRFNLYVTPQPLDWPLGQMYQPPEAESHLIEHLIRHKYYPVVNAVRGPEVSEVREMTGIVLTRNYKLMRCNQYDGTDPILCIQWYLEALSNADVDVILQFCAPFYGLGTHRSYVTSKEQELIDQGFMSPVPPLELLQKSEFIGNVVQMTKDQINVIE